MLPDLIANYPNAVFFGEKIVFKKETVFTDWLHNTVIQKLQKVIYLKGVPFVIITAKV